MTDKISHEDLDAAAQAAEETSAEESVSEESGENEEVKEEESKENGEKEQVEDESLVLHKESSKLGRKVKGISEELEELKSMMRQMMEKRERDRDEQGEDSIVATREDVINVIREQERVKEEKRQQYNKAAEKAIIDLGMTLDDDEFVEVYKIAQKNWKAKTGNAAIDAELNYNAALSSYLSGKIKKPGPSKPANPLEKNTGKESKNLGGSSESKVKVKEKVMPELDDYAKDFVARTGMSEESVIKALDGPAPTYLSGKI